MDVVIAGAHGQIARRLTRLLAARGDRVRGIIRNPDHATDLESDGAEPVALDMEQAGEQELAEAVRGAEAAVFAAGAGPGSGPARKQTVDLGAAVKLVAACEAAGVPRYVIVSSIGAHDPASGGGSMGPYLEAKAAADEALMKSSLAWTVVRPGSLNDDPGTGRVDVSSELGRRGPIPRDDVAQILRACLDVPETAGLVFEAFAGDQEVDLAVRTLARAEA
jgi:uncharacterized protein YbjT (DUF2867 family)